MAVNVTYNLPDTLSEGGDSYQVNIRLEITETSAETSSVDNFQFRPGDRLSPLQFEFSLDGINWALNGNGVTLFDGKALGELLGVGTYNYVAYIRAMDDSRVEGTHSGVAQLIAFTTVASKTTQVFNVTPSITILDNDQVLNTAPTDIILSATTITENVAVGTGIKIGDITITDPDPSGNNNILSLEGADAASFAIVNGQELYYIGSSPDFESKPSYSLTLKSTDANGGTSLVFSKAFIVTVNNLNEVPTGISLSNATVTENAVAATIGILTVTDPDAGDTHSFAVSDSRFEVVNGALKLKSGISLDFEAASSVSLNVTATDPGGLSKTQGFTINVTDLIENTAPTDLTLSATTVDENVAAGTTVGTFSTIDAEGGSFTYALVSGTSDADNAAFTLSGNQLKINASPNFEAKNSYSIRVKTIDTEGASYEEALTIAVNNVNEAPDAVNDTNFTANQSSPKVIAWADLLANDTDPDAGTTLSITGVSNVVGGGVALSGSTVVFTPNSSFSGTASFVYTLSDGGLTDTATVTLAVGTTFNGSNGKDTFLGTAGDDIINGGNGVDTLSGGAGDDLINGGNGADLLTGGTGRDRFVLDKNAGGDTITDFADGFDAIGLSGGLTFGQLTVTASGSNTQIQLGTNILAILTGVNSNLITATDFVTV